MTHQCHWEGCYKEVPPKLWGCKKHWFALPLWIRDRIWATYRPGQEISKDPSASYIEVAKVAKVYCKVMNEYGLKAPKEKIDEEVKKFLKGKVSFI